MKTIKLKAPAIPYDDWTIEEDNRMESFDPSKLILHLEPEQEDGYITGNILRERLKGKNPLSASILDYLIEHPEIIPESWKEKTAKGTTQFIYFFGTIYRSRSGNLYVRYWCWDEGRWQSDYYWLDYYWRGLDPSALLASPSSSEPESSLDSLSLELRVQKLEEIISHHNLGV